MTNEVGGGTPPLPAIPPSQAAANARSATVSNQDSFTQVLESANAWAPAPATRSPAAARKEAEYWANFAESLLAMIGEAMVNHNRHLDLMKNHWANIARLHGPEVAARLQAEDATLTRHEKIIRAGRTALRENFTVTGEIAMKDADGYYHFGDFVLSRMGEGFSLKIDSKYGTRVVFGRGSGYSNFGRESAIESDYLPWTLDDEEEE